MVKKICSTGMACWICMLFSIAAAEFRVPLISGRVPEADGVIHKEEWKNAVAISGAGTVIDPRRVELFVTWDVNHLYLAVRSETPPRGELTARNLDVVLDDSVEFWFAPPEELRDIEMLKHGEFQLIVSHTGARYQMHHHPGYGYPSRKWAAPGMKCAGSVRDSHWDFEAAIPASAFGFSRLPEMSWRILAVRNFRTEPEAQAPFFPVKNFSDSRQYPVWHFCGAGPAVRQLYENDGARHPLRLESAGKEMLFWEMISGGVRQSGHLPATVQFGMPPASADLTVRDRTGKIFFRRTVAWDRIPPRVWHTPASHIVLEQDFEKPDREFTIAPPGVKTESPEKRKFTAGRKAGDRALFLDRDNGGYACRGAGLAVPGNVSMWVRLEGEVVNTYRRLWGTSYQAGNGHYLGLQEQPGCMLFFLEGFDGKNEYISIPRKPVHGVWNHFSVNIQPRRLDCYMNGLKVMEKELPFVIDGRTLGNFVVGGGMKGASIDSWTMYDRLLQPGEIQALAQGEKKVTGKLGWYPSKNAAVLDVACRPAEISGGKLDLEISREDGRVVFTRPVSLKSGFLSGSGSLQIVSLREKIVLPFPLADGIYFMSLKVAGRPQPLMEKRFQHRLYPWMNTELGRKDRVLPGFQKLSVSGRRISCVLRDYIIGDNGLPEQIVSMGSELLAAPVTVNFLRNGRLFAAEGKRNSSIRKISDTTAVYSSKGPEVQVRGRLEQDGLLRLNLELSASLQTERLYMDIPVRKEFAVLYHAVGESIRCNPAGYIPAGTGTVFGSRKIRGGELQNFIPYLWVGDDCRGICYAADWDKGWIHSKKRDAVELIRRKNGDVVIRLNLMNGQPQYQGRRTITVALMGTPVKPMPDGWRGWANDFETRGNRHSAYFASPTYWGCYLGWSARYPAFQDFGLIRKMAEAARTGKIDWNFAEQWKKRLLQARTEEVPWIRIGYPWDLKAAKAPKFAENLVESTVHHSLLRSQALYGKERPVMIFYTCDRDEANCLPEYSVMQDEWGKYAMITDSYQDYAVYYFDKMLAAGMSGIYNDNTFLACSEDWADGQAYIGEDGKVHPSVGMWSRREYRRRLMNLMVEYGLEPWLTVHHTNGNILPILSYATNSLGMEWKYGTEDFQERFSPDYIRAVCQGLQGGFFPTVLDGVLGAKSASEKRRLTRTMLASLMPHEVRVCLFRGADVEFIAGSYNLLYDFGIWRKECRYAAYWNPENPVKSPDARILVSTYVLGRKMLLVCGSFADEDIQMELKMPEKISSAENLENSHKETFTERSLTLKMPRHDFKLVLVDLQQ